MKKWVFLLCFVSVGVYAESAKTCELVNDTSETLMQLHQSGLSLGDVDLNLDALSEKEAVLLKAMIEDAKSSPVYQIEFTRKKAIDDFKLKWQQRCAQEHGEIIDSTNS